MSVVRVVHLSDLHIHRQDLEENQNCRRIVKYLLKRYSKSARPIVLVTGDLTDGGTEEQYRQVAVLLQPLVKDGFRLLVCPGNHDYGLFGNRFIPESQLFFQRYLLGGLLGMETARSRTNHMSDLYPLVTETEQTLFIGLDSALDHEVQHGDIINGEIGKQQFYRLAQILKEQKPAALVVYFHHHPFFVARDHVSRIADGDRLMDLLSNRATIVCFGHGHRASVWYGKNGVNWFLLSGKVTGPTAFGQIQFREFVLNGASNAVTTLSIQSNHQEV